MSGREKKNYQKNWRKKNEKNKKFKKMSSDMKFMPLGESGNKSGVTFTKVRDHLMFEIQKKFDKYGSDIAKSIQTGSKIDLLAYKPNRRRSTEVNEQDRLFEQSTFDMEYKSELEKYKKREEVFEENKKKAFAWIFHSYCSKEMQTQLKENSNFESAIFNDPIKLLSEIQLAMNQPRRGQFPFVMFFESWKRFVLLWQKDDEELSEFGQRVKQEMLQMTTQFGFEIFSHAIKQTEEYKNQPDSSSKKKLLGDGMETFLTIVLIQGANRKRYGDFFDVLKQRFALKQDEFPRSLENAIEGLSEYSKKVTKEKWRKNKSSNNNNNDNDNDSQRQTSFAQRERKCYCCGSKNHVLPQCREKATRPKEDWFKPEYHRDNQNN